MKRYGKAVCLLTGFLSAMLICMVGSRYGVRAAEEDFVIQDGVLKEYKGDEEDVVIPDGVTEIESLAFSCNTTIRSVTIPEGVRVIGVSAFNGCDNLEHVNLSYGLEVIERNVFMDCKSLKSIVIPEGVMELGNSLFKACDSLADITIPSSVKTFGSNAFWGTPWLESELEGLTKENPFLVLNRILIAVKRDVKEDVSVPYGVVAIADRGFAQSSVTGIKISDSVKTIGNAAFEGCPNLEWVEMTDSVTVLGHDAFGACWNLKRVRLSNSIQELVDTFYDNKYLEEVELPEDLEYARSLFNNCRRLKKVVAHPKLKTMIGLFLWTPRVVFYVDKGSYAEKHASGLKGNERVAYAYNGVRIKSYTVKRGDSLWSISRKLTGRGTRYPEIMHLNMLDSTKLYPGQKLKVPV